MLKRNSTLTNPLLQKKRPTLLSKSDDDITSSSFSPQDSDYSTTSGTTKGASSTGANAGLPSWLGQRPATLDERFQLSIDNNSQEGEAPAKNNVISNDMLSKKYASAIVEVAKRNKQISTGLVSPSMKPTDSAGSPTRPRNGEQTSPRKGTTVPVSSTGALTEEQSELAAIVDKLPESFDLSKWDEMTAFQQQNALKNSGLTGEEQMTLLNAPTSIKTIATIQDIQTNRAEYGLTQASADRISSELLKIANARVGVNNRALPFASDFQRNLFLKELDKDEQKLLESVGGQEKSSRDMLFKDNRWFDFDQPVKSPAPKVITEVDNNSKLASVAKEILKAYIGVRYILPTTLAINSLEEMGKMIDKGTISVGGSLTGVYIGGPTVNGGLVIDHTGDVGIIYTYGGYGGTPSASAVAFASISNADSIEGLNGQSFEIGGSAGLGFSIGGEFCTFTDHMTNDLKMAVNLNIGGGVTPPGFPLEGHAGLVNSSVDVAFNIFDTWNAILEEYNKWQPSQME